MSRIGKKTIEIPSTVKIEINGQDVKAVGPKGELKTTIHQDIKAEVKDGKVFVAPNRKLIKGARGLWGLYRALIFKNSAR